jgi:hypothetical protein
MGGLRYVMALGTRRKTYMNWTKYYNIVGNVVEMS